MSKLFTIVSSHEIGIFCGACDYEYSIKLNKICTVKEFIDDVLTNVNEWGYIGINNNFNIFGDPYCAYGDGKLLSDMPSNILNKKVVKATATGGWTRMDYILHLS